MLALLCFQANAQQKNKRARTSISFGTQVEIPTGEFQNIHGESIFGFGGAFLRRSHIPFLQTGINFTYGQAGRYTKDVSMVIGETYNGAPVYEDADVIAKQKVYRTHGALRFVPFKGSVQPYLEGMAGFKMYSTSVKLEQGSGRNSMVVDRYNLERSYTTSYGLAAGIKIELSDGFFIEGKYEHLTGGVAEYVDPNSFSMNSKEEFVYDLNESRTNSSMVHLGVSFDF